MTARHLAGDDGAHDGPNQTSIRFKHTGVYMALLAVCCHKQHWHATIELYLWGGRQSPAASRPQTPANPEDAIATRP